MEFFVNFFLEVFMFTYRIYCVLPFKHEASIILFKDPVRTAQ